MQTTDTHGSYRHAVDAPGGALDLHGDGFGEQIAAHPDWPGRKVEGPNISNVVKRTFYQVMFTFQITRRESSAGCILALPRPVWDSWQPFLGAPDLMDRGDGTHRLVVPARDDDTGFDPDDVAEPAPNWIYVFDVADKPPADGSTTPIEVQLVVATDAPTLSTLALDVAPANAIGDTLDVDTCSWPCTAAPARTSPTSPDPERAHTREHAGDSPRRSRLRPAHGRLARGRRRVEHTDDHRLGSVDRDLDWPDVDLGLLLRPRLASAVRGGRACYRC